MLCNTLGSLYGRNVLEKDFFKRKMYGSERRRIWLILHLHILPGLDDGAEDLETAVRMAKWQLIGGVFIWRQPAMEIIMIIR